MTTSLVTKLDVNQIIIQVANAICYYFDIKMTLKTSF